MKSTRDIGRLPNAQSQLALISLSELEETGRQMKQRSKLDEMALFSMSFMVSSYNHVVIEYQYVFYGAYSCQSEIIRPESQKSDPLTNGQYKSEMASTSSHCSHRTGNEPESSGDGWKYRGRGLIQLTGKNNYRSMTASFGVDVVNNPSLCEQPKFAALSAGWFWQTNGLNALADAKDVVGMTKRINGGTNGLADRQARYNKACSVLGC